MKRRRDLRILVVQPLPVARKEAQIPAVFAITDDPFLVFTSNIMAVLGLRSLYFALAGIIQRFYYLRLSLSLLLVLIGAKMLLKDILHALPDTTYYTLGAICLILAGGVIASIIRARRTPESGKVEIPARQERVVKVHP